MAQKFPRRGSILSIAGATITDAYHADMTSSTINVGRFVSPVRFYIKITTKAASSVTEVKAKLQQRYNEDDATIEGVFADIPSEKGDAAKTHEVEHTWSALAANATTWVDFYLANPGGIPDLQCLVHANGAGDTGDAIVVYVAV